MRTATVCLIAVLAVLALAMPEASAAACPPDSVQVGPACVDKYEASVWSIPANRTALIQRVQRGRATLADLLAGGATQHNCGTGPTGYPATFPFSGNWTQPVYAVSVPGVLPSTCITWFQAEQACALSEKRLLTNQEWQRAAAGTPDPGELGTSPQCNTSDGAASLTGAQTSCRSSWGVYDMVGNVWEWVADWVSLTAQCTFWPVGDDMSCMGTAGADYPGALLRGGSYGNYTAAGVLAVAGNWAPLLSDTSIGFRCAR